MQSAKHLFAVFISTTGLLAGCADGPQITIFHEERPQ
jgi:hypothetical protein